MESDQNIKHPDKVTCRNKESRTFGIYRYHIIRNSKDALSSGCAKVHVALGCDMEAMVAIEMVVEWRYKP